MTDLEYLDGLIHCAEHAPSPTERAMARDEATRLMDRMSAGRDRPVAARRNPAEVLRDRLRAAPTRRGGSAPMSLTGEHYFELDPRTGRLFRVV